MDNAEIVQCVLDIKSWFSRGKGQKRINSGATSVDLQRLQKALDLEIPRILRIVLGEINGGIYFMDKEQLSSERILEVASALDGSRKWRSGLVPVAGDDNSMLVIDSKTDEVLEWDSDEGLGDVVAPNLMRYLEDYRNNLLGGHFEFLDEIGVVEKMTSKASRK
jgi:hypothetical protein